MPVVVRPSSIIRDGRLLLGLFLAAWTIAVLLPLLGAVVFSFLESKGMKWSASLSVRSYLDIFLTGRWEVILRTMAMAGLVTAICLVIGFPFAYWLAKRARNEWLKHAIFIAMTVPLFLDPSARTLVWRALLGTTGLVNTLLLDLGVIGKSLEWLLFSDFSVGFGLLAPYFPNMVWPIYLAILLIDDELIAAARDLGASPFAAFRDIVVPLSLPGIAAGIVFTFVPVLGDNVVTRLLGGGQREYLADSVASLVTAMNYSGAAAFATIILAVTALDEAIADDAVNMWGVAKLAGLIHNIGEPDYERWPTALEVLDCLIRGGNAAMRQPELGAIAPGKLADLCLVDLESLAFTPLNDLHRQLVYCENGSSVRLTMVDGEVVFRGGRLTRVDEAALLAEARGIAADRRAALALAADAAEALRPAYREMYLKAAKTDVGMNRWVGDSEREMN